MCVCVYMRTSVCIGGKDDVTHFFALPPIPDFTIIPPPSCTGIFPCCWDFFPGTGHLLQERVPSLTRATIPGCIAWLES